MSATRRRARGRTGVVVLVLALSAGAAACTSSGGSHARPTVGTGSGGPSSGATPTGTGAKPMASEDRFLRDYVKPDGAVVRHDQGNDIVSEGQAYGMLVAEVAGKPELVRTIWSWTKAHLPGKNGLIASRANSNGQVQDSNSAADADILAAYALLRYDGPDSAGLHADGRRLADGILAAESVTVGGRPVIVAGPWAVSPPRVDPSYWMPSVYRALAGYTGDKRWNQAADSAMDLLEQVTSNGQQLPPDWAKLNGDQLDPIASPSGGAPVQYGLDAARLPVWLATGCTDRERKLSASWWRLLSVGDSATYLALSLSGQPINQAKHPLSALAGAAAAGAAGDRSAAESLRVRANDFAGEHPTYYGVAWLALGAALLNGDLDPCSDGTSSR